MGHLAEEGAPLCEREVDEWSFVEQEEVEQD